MNQHLKQNVDPEKTGSPNEVDSDRLDLIPMEEKLHDLADLAMIGRITPEVVHDINNQLTGILGYAELLLMKKIEDPSIRNGLKNILLSAEKSKVLLDNLLVLSHQKTSSISLTNVNLLLEKTLEIRSCALRHRQIEYVMELGKDIPTISLEVAKFQKTILNLIFKIEEVLEQQPQGKKLILETAFIPQDHELIIRISDNVSETHADRRITLSEPDLENLSPDLGIRLGLIDACRWIWNVGGYLVVESVKGKGTAFTIHWPVKG